MIIKLSWFAHRYIPDSKDDPQISFVAHLAGVFSGLTIGLVVLRNYEQRLVQCRSWWLAISLLLTLALTALLYHCFSKNDAFKIFCTENCSWLKLTLALLPVLMSDFIAQHCRAAALQHCKLNVIFKKNSYCKNSFKRKILANRIFTHQPNFLLGSKTVVFKNCP